uniref:ATP synthase complex subunit 8 n=1 Tax=Byturus ochraceus TaxID=153018 RepID=A0A343A3Q0_9CUCU|nr:ATP synthase F0 subunit 8 [Byturus ochraceus]AOY39178.1 ATP synthase F0 subunit 8 [Byturus ochraceus]
MPQMAPMNWISLFISFLIIYMFINTLNYFSFKYSFKPSKTLKSLISINWKW